MDRSTISNCRQQDELNAWLLAELRSDHAGETGAVCIYQGILAVSRDPRVREFASTHLATEQEHLELISAVIADKKRSIFTPMWRLAGFLTGAIPALFGPSAVFATIDAVETFVDMHYQQQIDRLRAADQQPEIVALLERCREDEIKHRDEARSLITRRPVLVLRVWCWLVGSGSATAVKLARWR